MKESEKKAFWNHALCHRIVACHKKIVAPAQKRGTAQYLTVCMAVEILCRKSHIRGCHNSVTQKPQWHG